MTTVYPSHDHRVSAVEIAPYWASDGQHGWMVTARLRSGGDPGGKDVAEAAAALSERLGGWWIIGQVDDGRIVLRATKQGADFIAAWALAGDILDAYALD